MKGTEARPYRTTLLLIGLAGLAANVLHGIAPLLWFSDHCIPGVNVGVLGFLTGLGTLLVLLILAVGLLIAIALAFAGKARWRDIANHAFLMPFLLGCAVVSEQAAQATADVALRPRVQALQPVIQAVEQYVKDHQRAPDRLADLVPDYLAEPPTTGMCADRFKLDYANFPPEPWRLRIHLWNDFADPIYIQYQADEHYDRFGFERMIEEWALYHLP